MNRSAVSEADEIDMDRLLARREAGVNRQLGMALLCTSVAYAVCLTCSLTRVFLTGRLLGLVVFLPGIVMMMSAVFVVRRFGRGTRHQPWIKHYMCIALALSVYLLSLIQLVWSVPLIIGGLAFVYSYLNVRMVVVYNTVTLAFLLLGAGMNALWGMPNPDMLPFPSDIQGVKDGYVTLWAMAHREAWSHWSYFLRILRFHTLPMTFLLMIVGGCGYAMVSHSKRRLLETLARERRIREIESCILLMAGGNQPQELILAVLREEGIQEACRPPLSQSFVDSIPAESIPKLMREFRKKCLEDADFAALSTTNPEAALKRVLSFDCLT